jgi:hypothetical protein
MNPVAAVLNSSARVAADGTTSRGSIIAAARDASIANAENATSLSVSVSCSGRWTLAR